MKTLNNLYKLKEFKEKFNSKLRKPAEKDQKFDQLKYELNQHLKEMGETSKVLPNLKIYIEDYSLCFSYTEISGSDLEVRLIWKIVEINDVKVNNLVSSFCKVLKIEEELPKIQITNGFTRSNFALYYPNEKKILVSNHFILQHKWSLVKAVIKHEILHHYCFIKNMGARDTDEDFIKLLIIHKAYISKAPDAQKAYKDFLMKNTSDFLKKFSK